MGTAGGDGFDVWSIILIKVDGLGGVDYTWRACSALPLVVVTPSENVTMSSLNESVVRSTGDSLGLVVK